MVAHLEKSSSPSVGFAILAQLKMINPIDYCQLKKDHIKPQIAVFFKIDIPVQLGDYQHDPSPLASSPWMQCQLIIKDILVGHCLFSNNPCWKRCTIFSSFDMCSWIYLVIPIILPITDHVVNPHNLIPIKYHLTTNHCCCCWTILSRICLQGIHRIVVN